MTMQKSYYEDMLEQLRETDLEETCPDKSLTLADIEEDDALIDHLWYEYQKNVEEYGIDPEFAIQYAMEECIPAKKEAC